MVWAICVALLLIGFKMVDGYTGPPKPIYDMTFPTSVQDTLTGKKYGSI